VRLAIARPGRSRSIEILVISPAAKSGGSSNYDGDPGMDTMYSYAETEACDIFPRPDPIRWQRADQAMRQSDGGDEKHVLMAKGG
jgi:hypothetical protein